MTRILLAILLAGALAACGTTNVDPLHAARRPSPTIPARVSTISSVRWPIVAASGSSAPGASSGTSARSGITAMSCSSRIASAVRPCSVASTAGTGAA